ncbi:Het-C-domain-containing protein [Delitschia confertaspora ATCC 74209]|uniref:Het-C-domain-containing protein n=1 Tax=Delitschia confertaspora ATCC 74209 TaxID=1513339 RepID=A0A9P4MTB0_9PLEO|nr:Het-C-domain-containing protein [Delitschia confertaspora ATCC 74209]
MALSNKYLFLLLIVVLVLLPGKAEAFGAGNIASISKIEGKNWRHGDIEDMLATVACLRGHKWNSMMIKRVYFGNWLRDYSQAVDVATLKGVQAETIRVLVWILAFMSFGYATAEFEVTSERLGVYRPEEHIDNPRDYADNIDARKYDARLRGPVSPDELAVDPETGMKNYIANERGGWATSSGYVKFSFARAIHFGRMYTHGPSGQRGREEDLCEALRCLGQGLHCLEDFGAHTNYTELVLRELGFNNVFPHTGTATQMYLHGKHVYPLVTGTFGGVDFFHSVLGEATDHFTQTEIDQMNTALADALTSNTKGGPGSGSNSFSALTDALGKVPGTGQLIKEAQDLQASSDAQAAANTHSYSRGGYDDQYNNTRADPHQQQPMSFDAPPGSIGGPPGPNIPGTSVDPSTIIPKIYPILEFRDKVVRSISAIVSKIPGLEKLIETITERVTLFVLSLLAPFVQPIIKAASQQLKLGSSAVIDASGHHQYEPWTDPNCTDPTHSLLSKDHFSNILNEPAGQVASAILQYVAPRIVYAWDHPDVPVDQVLDDVTRVFHHPAVRDHTCELHRNMFDAVKTWVDSRPDRGHSLDHILSSESVRAGKNHSGHNDHTHGQGGYGAAGLGNFGAHGGAHAHSHSQHPPQSHSGGHGGYSGGHGSSEGGFNIPGISTLTSNLPSSLTSAINNTPFNLLTKPRDYDPSTETPSQPSQQPSPGPGAGNWGSFQPYGGQHHQASQRSGYEYQAPAPTGGAWGYGEYSGGQGEIPAYTVPTAYQQGYEGYAQGQPPVQGGYRAYGEEQQPPYGQHNGQHGGGGYGGSYGGY